MPACTALLIAAVTSARARRTSFLTRSARSAKRSLSPFRSAESVSDSPAIGSISAALAGRHGGIGGEDLVFAQLVLALPLVQLVVPVVVLVAAIVLLVAGGVEQAEQHEPSQRGHAEQERRPAPGQIRGRLEQLPGRLVPDGVGNTLDP